MNSSKDTQATDLKYFRERFDTIIKTINSQVEYSEKGMKQYTKSLIDTTESSFKLEYENIINLFGESKLENHKLMQEIKKNSKELRTESEKNMNLKEEILSNIDQILINFKGKINMSNKEVMNEFELMKRVNT